MIAFVSIDSVVYRNDFKIGSAIVGMLLPEHELFFAIITPLILVGTAIVIILQIQEQTKYRRLEAYNHLYDTLASDESRKARQAVYEAYKQGHLNPDNYERLKTYKIYKELRYAIGRVTSDYDHIGKLVDSNNIERDPAYEIYGGSAYRMYRILEYYLKEANYERNEGLPWNIEHYYYFKQFFKNSKLYWDNRRGRVREPEYYGKFENPI